MRSPHGGSQAKAVRAIVGCAHLFRPTYPDFLQESPPAPACAAFIKEAPVLFLMVWLLGHGVIHRTLRSL
jgi:hypothetical protein